MAGERVGTIFTTVIDTFASLFAQLGLSKTELLELNPHLAELDEISPGIPIDVPIAARQSLMNTRGGGRRARGLSPYEIAKQELQKDIREVVGSGDNPRIREYHATTSGGAMPDSVPWCSSFMNFCVEQAGLVGTDSKAARSWHTKKWGAEVPKEDWQEGDIMVFWRESRTQSTLGHVGFIVSLNGMRPQLLGGNQGDRVSIGTPSKFNEILSVRRP
jgi:uncharacterized protein (TIGR02594 family)